MPDAGLLQQGFEIDDIFGVLMFNKPTVRFSSQSRQSTAKAFPECLTRDVFPL
jgi:hypothetical protein